MPKDASRRVNTYLISLRPDLRLRIHIESEKGLTVHFAITLECELAENDWRAVVRYDTTGGTVHRDRLRPDGGYLTHRESVRMGYDLNDALRNSRNELTTNCERYVSEFHQLL